MRENTLLVRHGHIRAETIFRSQRRQHFVHFFRRHRVFYIFRFRDVTLAQRGVLHRGRNRMSERIAKEVEIVHGGVKRVSGKRLSVGRYTCLLATATCDRRLENVGNESATHSQPSITVSPSAISPATASDMARRWSLCAFTCAPRNFVGPTIVKPS